MRVRQLDRVFEPRGREWVLAADVDEALLGTRRVAGDRERLQDGERIVLHQDPVLERAGLGFVGVADEVVGLDRLLRDRLPLHTCGERRAAPPLELRVLELGDHALGTELDRPPERLVATVRPVVIERRRIDDADPAEQSELLARAVGLRRDVRDLRAAHHRPGTAVQERVEPFDRDRAERHVPRAGALQERRRRALAHPEAGASKDLLGTDLSDHLVDHALGTRDLARDVVAQVQDRRRARFDREHRVERRDAVGLGGRDREALARVAETAGTDPARARLQRMQDGEQQVALLPGLVPAPSHTPVRLGPFPTRPARGRRAEDRVDGGAFVVAGEVVGEDEVHGGARPPPTRRSCRSGPRSP